MSADRIFLDTNVIVYGYDRSAGRKHEIAKTLLIDLWNAEGAVLSTQVLQELYVTVTLKIPRRLSQKAAKEIVSDLLAWDVVTNDGETVVQAINIHAAEGLSFWDALIVAAAKKGAANVILSEDFPDGKRFGNVAVKNPFACPRSE